MKRRTAPAHRAASRRPFPLVLACLVAVVVLVVGIVIALLGVGGSYALMTDSLVIDGATVTTGSTSLTINGDSEHAITGMDLAAIGPGQSTIVPLTLLNTGSTTLSVSISSIAIADEADALAASLTVRLAEATAGCAISPTGGITGRMTNFASTSTGDPFVVSPEQSLPLCLEVTMDPTAPASVQDASTGFAIAIAALQVR